jgi:FAD/FMN-containing dehydrogenase/Fe-S oxidoreductase
MTAVNVRTNDARDLERRLRTEVEGDVRFDSASRALYATDASNFRQPPIGVVIPRSVDDVIAAHAVCREYQAPILSRGCGTSLSGETVNHAVVIDHSKHLTEIHEPDEERRLIRCRAGAINDHVNLAAGKHDLMFGPDPATHEYCTIGGNIGNNSCGTHSVHARMMGNGSRTSDNVHGLEVLTYDGVRMHVGPTSDDELERIVAAGGRRGEIYAALRDLRDRYAGLIRERFVDIPRRVSGYNLDELLPEKGFDVARALVGTEGTCVTILEATLKLVPRPKQRSLLVLGYDSLGDLGDHIPEILAVKPMACEGIDEELFRLEQQTHIHPEALKHLPDGNAWVLVEFGGETKEEADERARELESRLRKDRRPPKGLSLFEDPEEAARLWKVRQSGLAATTFPEDGRDYWPGWEDSAVPPERVGDYLRDLRALLDRYGYGGALFGHLGDGCIHTNTNFDLRTAPGVQAYRSFMEDAADLVVSYGGSLSGEHGDGQQRAELLPRMFGEELVDAFREFKRIWDPDWKMNPGKVVDPYRFDENLKLGPDSNPRRPSVRFDYAQDHHDFTHATIRCIGVGKCRRPEGVDVMCPSFMATREEMHTTRGRARLLFEMLEGDVITDGWRSKEVEEALDLCLSCKGCTNDCPVNVDMPTYKAEFLHHHYKGRIRPRHAYALGLIDKASRVASKIPGVANFVTHAPVVSRLVKFAAGVTQEREAPSFAPLSLREWFFARGGRNVGGPRVVVFPDTFNTYMHTDVGVAAIEAIEAAGWHVVMPRTHICCGRPLYDYGFLTLAEKYLHHVLDELRDDIRAGTPIVGIEPSCLATLKDELVKLLPNDDDARRLSRQAYHFAEFFQEFEIDVPSLRRKALVWGHCHHKATGGIQPELDLLKRMGVEVEQAKGGCCGLAGSWGFESEHHDLSMQIGELGVLPAVREATLDDVIVADGFSCRTQIEQGRTGRRGLHVAQVMKLAREHGPDGTTPGVRPEHPYYQVRPEAPRSLKLKRAALGAGIAAGLTGATIALLRRAR